MSKTAIEEADAKVRATEQALLAARHEHAEAVRIEQETQAGSAMDAARERARQRIADMGISADRASA